MRNQVRRMTRKAQKHHKMEIAKDVIQNLKRKFWIYANKKTKTKQGIPNLSKSGNPKCTDLTENDLEKAEVLAEYFSSVYTQEPDGNWELPPVIN